VLKRMHKKRTSFKGSSHLKSKSTMRIILC
jgi:hypothetical protein